MAKQGLDADTLNEVLETLKKFGEKYFHREQRLRADKEDVFPERLIRKMLSPDIGLHLLLLPEEYDGFGGGAYDIYRVSEEMAKIDLGMATAFLAISLGSDPLRVGGSEEQKRLWMGRIANEGLIVAYGATEPSAGSDLAALTTKAEPITNDEGKTIAYRLNGVKQFITNGSVADLYSILAKTPSGPSFFVVEKGAPGLSSGKPEEKHGIRLSNTSQVILENVEVAPDHLIGLKEGEGIAQAVAVFGYTRLMVAAFGLGGGEAAFNCALNYAKERSQFGKKLIEMQGYVYKLLVPHAVKLEAARAYIEEIARRLDSGETGLETEGAIAKLVATEAGNQAADAAIQAHGGYGYIHEYEVEKIRRDVRITTIYEGTSEIMQQTIAKDRWRRFLQSRGQFYVKLAQEMEELAIQDPPCGANAVAKSVRALGYAMEYARKNRLTRQQFALFKLADMASGVETAAALCRKSVALKKNSSGNCDYVRCAARIYSAEVASSVSRDALFYLAGLGVKSVSEIAAFREGIGLNALTECCLGLGENMVEMAQSLSEN